MTDQAVPPPNRTGLATEATAPRAPATPPSQTRRRAWQKVAGDRTKDISRRSKFLYGVGGLVAAIASRETKNQPRPDPEPETTSAPTPLT